MSKKHNDPLLKEAQELATREPPQEDPTYQQGRAICLLSLSSRKFLPERSESSRSDAGDDVTKIDPVGAYILAYAATSGNFPRSEGSLYLLYLLPGGVYCGYDYSTAHSRGVSAGKWARAGAHIRLAGVRETLGDCNFPFRWFAPFEEEFELHLKDDRLTLRRVHGPDVKLDKWLAENGLEEAPDWPPPEPAYTYAGWVCILPQTFGGYREFTGTDFADLREFAANLLRRAEDEGCYVGAEGFYVN
jgi:hypothetical protein